MRGGVERVLRGGVLEGVLGSFVERGWVERVLRAGDSHDYILSFRPFD